MRILLDQNVPRATADWLLAQRPDWTVEHASDLGFGQAADEVLAEWATANEAVIVTFDEDFLDRRRFPPGTRPPIVRLRVWPTTQVIIEGALARLLSEVPDATLRESVTIVDRNRIRSEKR